MLLTQEAWTALHRAAWKGHDRIIAPLLLDAGADITALTRDGDNALHTASRYGHAAAARALLAAGVDADSLNHVRLAQAHRRPFHAHALALSSMRRWAKHRWR